MIVFNETDDFIKFKDILLKCKEKHGCLLYHYELMSNHYHLIVMTEPAVLPKIMHKLDREYSLYHKKKYDRVGPLWQSRYKNRLITSQTQLLICGAYIELNAVRAGIVSDPADYRWGSYRHYAGIEHDPLIDPNPEYIDLSPEPEERQKLYRLCMELWDARNYQPVISTPQIKQVEK